MALEAKKNKNETAERRISVLVVDDEESIRSLLSDILTESGFNVETASDGAEALEKAQTMSFQIIITDLRMPGISGMEVMAKFKEINSSSSIIAMTGYPSMETALEAIHKGAYDYITKPFNLSELRIIINRAAEKQMLQIEKELYKELSITDGLTQLYNHRFFHEILPRELSRSDRYHHQVALLMIDIDDFKKYNDAYGHPSGDEVLKSMGQIFLQCLRKVDYAFRYGGEEFTVILPETGYEGGVACARRIRSTVAQTKFKYLEDEGRWLTVSIGVSVYPVDAKAKDELVAKADQTLYAAKHLGKNRICVYEVADIKTVEGSSP